MWERKAKAVIKEPVYLTTAQFLTLSNAEFVLPTTIHNDVQWNSSYRF